MSNFRVGQKVVCLDVPWPDYTSQVVAKGARLPMTGNVYTVRWIGTARDGHVYVRLDEIVNPVMEFPGWGPGEPRFGARRFRPVVERGTEKGMSILRELLNKTDKSVEVAA